MLETFNSKREVYSAPWGFGERMVEEWLFIFRELWSTGNYFQGFWEQAHSFGDLGSPAKSKKISPLRKSLHSFDFFFFKKFFGFLGGGGGGGDLENLNVVTFVLTN